MVGDPEVDVNGVKDTEEGEPPRDALNDSVVTILSELVDDGSEE